MKKVLIQTVALLMALVTMIGCKADPSKLLVVTEKVTENVTEAQTDAVTETQPVTEAETIPVVIETIPEETEAQTEAVTEEVTEPQVEEIPTIPGSEQLPATALLNYTYSQLRALEWTRSSTQEGEIWLLQAKSCWTDFTFMFYGEYLDPNAKPTFLTIDDPDGDGYAYVAEGIKINDTAADLPAEIQEKIMPMDSGFCVMAMLDDVSATMMFYSTRDRKPGKLYNIQFQQEV